MLEFLSKYWRYREEQKLKIIVGLGNPGKEYAETRHNVGFMVVDHLAGDLGISIDKKKYSAHYGEGKLGMEKVLLVKPQTFMNLSGQAVWPLAHWYKVSPEDIITIYDDMDLPLGKLRVRSQGSAGGHNGVKSLIASLGTEKFARVKLGIERSAQGDSIDHVLKPFLPLEKEIVTQAVKNAAEAVKTLVTDGIEKAMNRYNS